jgi:CheY-like chemotaxis protein
VPDVDFKSVLVVDDEEEWVETITAFLTEEGYSVIAAPNGIEALARLWEAQPFAVVTDLQMPIMDGRRLMDEIHTRDAHVPVIVVTASHPRDRDATLGGAFRVLGKPVPVEDLLSALVDAQAYRAQHVPRKTTWLAAGDTRPHCPRVAQSRLRTLLRLDALVPYVIPAVRVAAMALAVAASWALLKHRWRAA